MQFSQLKKFITPVALIAIAATVTLAARAADRGIVVLNANWCYSCREIIPITQEVGRQNNLNVTVIDIEAQDAPRLARTYGISIPNDRGQQAPWVYFVDRGRTVQIYSGASYRAGYGDAVRASLISNLQTVMGPPAASSVGRPTPMAPSAPERSDNVGDPPTR